MATRSKQGGFQHNNVYKIISMKDKQVIEVTGTGTLVMKKSTNATTQKFKAVQTCEGEFRVSPVGGIGPGGEQQQVWDFLPSSPVLILNDSSDGDNQSWVAEEIYPNSKICVIKAKNDGRCLRNSGSGKPITLVPEDRRDALTHWKLESTY